MNKKDLAEADIRTKFITRPGWPDGGKWDLMTQLREEVYFTKGRVMVRGKTVSRGEKRKVDYLMYYKPNLPIAIVEAKDTNHSVGAGMEQAIAYAECLDVPYAFNSNGDAFLEHDRTATSGTVEREFPLDQFPSPEELWARYRAAKGYTAEQGSSWEHLSDERLRMEPSVSARGTLGIQLGTVEVSAVTWGVYKPEENKALPPGMASRPDCEVKAGDVLLSRANTEDLVARGVVVGSTPPRPMMSDKIVRFTFPDEIEREYVHLANTSEASRAYYARNASGTSSSMKNIGREVMCNLPVPLPPLAEQRRIVAKVDELIALVDELEAQLAASRDAAAKFLTAVVAERTAPRQP